MLLLSASAYYRSYNRKMRPSSDANPSSGRVISGAIACRIRQQMTTGMVRIRIVSLTNHQMMRMGLNKILKKVDMGMEDGR